MNKAEFFASFFDFSDFGNFFYFPNYIWIIFFLALIWSGKKLFGFIVSYDLESELVKTDNKAVAVAFTAYIASIGIVIESVFEGATKSFTDEFIDIFIWSLIGIALLNFAGWINDKLILRKFQNRKELIEDRNVGTAAVIAGSYLASAIMIRAIIVGESQGWFLDISLTVFYFLLAQLTFFLFSLLYERLIGYDLHQEIEADNVAAGVSFGMNLIAIGILMAAPLRNTYSILIFALWFIIGTTTLAFVRFVLDRLMVPSESIDREIHQDRNWGIALFEGGLSLLAALLLIRIF